MSGPKVSVYELTEEMRALIIAERLRRQQEEEQRRLLLIRITKQRDRIDRIYEKLHSYDALVKECLLSNSFTEIKEMQKSIDAKIKNTATTITKVESTANSSDLEAKAEAIEGLARQIQNEQDIFEEAAKTAETSLQEKLSDSVVHLFEKSDAPCSDDAVNNQLATIRKEIDQVLSSECLPISFQKQLIDAKVKMENNISKDLISPYYTLEVCPILNKCKEYIKLWNQYGKEYEVLCNRYEVLLKELGMQDRAELIPFNEQANAKLNSLIKELEDQAQKLAEKQYITETLSSVMEEMGYNLWGKRTVEKKNGKKFKNELYQYENETAVSVTYSSNGQIALELGKVDECDRIPSKVESEVMENQMSEFCDKFKEIEKKLEERGIRIGSRLLLAPPCKEYAQIINLRDYQIVENSQIKHKGIKKASKRTLKLEE